MLDCWINCQSLMIMNATSKVCYFPLPFYVYFVNLCSFIGVFLSSSMQNFIVNFFSLVILVLPFIALFFFIFKSFLCFFYTILYSAEVKVYVTISTLQLISRHVFLAYRGLRPWELLNSQYWAASVNLLFPGILWFGFDYGYVVLVCYTVFFVVFILHLFSFSIFIIWSL